MSFIFNHDIITCIILVIGLYYMFRKGPKQKKALKKTYTILNIKKILPTRVEGTRWLPHMFRAINVLIKGYRGLRSQLENSSHAKDLPKLFLMLQSLYSY